MKAPNFSSLNFKVPAVITGLSCMIAIIIGTTSFLQFRETILQQKEAELAKATAAEAAVINGWVEGITRHVEDLAADPSTLTAINHFGEGWAYLGEDPSATVRRLYISENPQPVGQKHLLNRADDNSFYSIVHDRAHRVYAEVLERHSYYDLFLFDAEGNLIYSVFKEDDFGTNFVSGIYADSGLGDAFRRARGGASGQSHFVDFARYAPSNGAPAAFFSAPVTDETGDFAGAVSIQVPIEGLTDSLQELGGQSGHTQVYLVGMDGLLRSPLADGTGLGVLDPAPSTQQVALVADGEVGVLRQSVGVFGADVMAAFQSIDVMDSQWGLIVEGELAHIMQPLNAMAMSMLIGGVVALAVLTLIGWGLSMTITRPVRVVEGNLQRLANQEFDIESPYEKRRDEFGQISRALRDLRDKLFKASEIDAEVQRKAVEQEEVVQKLTSSLRALAEGDLTADLREPFAREFEDLRENYNATLETLRSLIADVVDNCTSIRAQSGEISKSADDLSNRTENQAATLEETAAALDQLTEGVKQAALNAKEVEDIVVDARSNAENGKSIVDEAVATMEKVESSSEQISEIISVIDEIAFQTNLLALNAGVEAGRAGEAGKGFAVVASEVGSLAHRSSDAARAIKKLIAESGQHVSKGVQSVSQAGDAISSIVERVSHISELMRGIASAAGDQSHSLDEINIGVNQLDQVTQQNAAMVENSTMNSHKLDSSVESLNQMVRRFKHDETSSGEVTSSPVESASIESVPEADNTVSFASKRTQAGTDCAQVEVDDAANSAVWMKF